MILFQSIYTASDINADPQALSIHNCTISTREILLSFLSIGYSIIYVPKGTTEAPAFVYPRQSNVQSSNQIQSIELFNISP